MGSRSSGASRRRINSEKDKLRSQEKLNVMSSAAKIGVFMLIILAILGYFVLKIEDVKIGRGAGTKKISAVFDSVAGLDNKSSVRVAGQMTATGLGCCTLRFGYWPIPHPTIMSLLVTS